MSLDSHVAILLGHSLDVAKMNKKGTRADFYAQFAFPPAAIGDLAALVSEAYPGVPLASIEVNIKPNAQQAKPFAGVPADWYVIRTASQFAPELYDATCTPIPSAEARQKFYAGMRVRVMSSAWPWKNEFGKSGASFNLHGIMDAGEAGERLNIGGAQVANAFKAHAQAAPATATGNAFAAHAPAPAVQAAPAAQQVTVAPVASDNPFAQAATAAGNPFAAAA